MLYVTAVEDFSRANSESERLKYYLHMDVHTRKYIHDSNFLIETEVVLIL